MLSHKYHLNHKTVDYSINGNLWSKCDNSFFSPKILAIKDNSWQINVTGFKYIRIYNATNIKIFA
jgi:hypothetical protein